MYQVEQTVEELDSALRALRRAMQGIPARREGFKTRHDQTAKAMATLTVNLLDSQAMFEP